MSEPEWMRRKSIALHDGTDTPELWPDGASPQYVEARLKVGPPSRRCGTTPIPAPRGAGGRR